MSNDTDLWTVRDALAKAGNREGVAAIGRITEELTRLRNGMVPEEDLSIAHVEQDRLRAERDEAVAALREAQTAMREVLDTHGDYEEFDPLRRFLGLPLWDSTESWKRRGEEAARFYTNQAGSSPSQDRERGNEDASDQGAAHGAAGVASLASPDSQPALSTPKGDR